MRAMTDSTSKQNTAQSQGDDAAASHIPCPTEPRIAPIVIEVDEDNRINVSVIKSFGSLSRGLSFKVKTHR